ncbi:MAG: ribonuclease H family protein [Muribaculaceae bacterium]|nr:ribonuclease H family protein [Muribaculaceae bacterium]
MAEKRKFYVVWEGRDPGVYDNWEDCQAQIDGFPGAKYKSFKSQQEAVEAFRGSGEEEETLLTRIALKNLESVTASPAPANPSPIVAESSRFPSSKTAKQAAPHIDYSRIPEINLGAIAVDGACAGNPGMMEYRGVKVADGEEIFHIGPLADGTNNVAEYLALVHALALLFKQNDSTTPIYTDSVTAVAWVRNRGCRTQLTPTERNRKIFEMLARANLWLRSHSPRNPILRWNTPMWGEIPADFGRK